MTSISKLEEHGVPVTAAAGPLDTHIVVYNVDQLHSLFDTGLDQQGRQAHYQALFNGIPTPPDAGAQLAQSVTAHVVGAAPLPAQARSDSAAMFPLSVAVTASAAPLTVRDCYDLSTPDGKPRIVAFGAVVLEPGGYFVCEGTPLQFTCDSLSRAGERTADYDFCILGKDGKKPATPLPQPGATQAGGGYGGECSSAGIAGHGGGPGSHGADGAPGTDGGPGGRGTPSMQATITIRQSLAGSLDIYTRSGAGGAGGDGGQGGPGQQGGNGGGGVTCGCTGNAGGQGGDGGNGGPGGKAGDGADGADALGNVVVQVPTAEAARLVTLHSDPSAPGAAGQPGPGGGPGSGGTGGGAGKDNNGGGAGGPGRYGAAGAHGAAAAKYGAAGQLDVQVL
jgi:hypothetical protein